LDFDVFHLEMDWCKVNYGTSSEMGKIDFYMGEIAIP